VARGRFGQRALAQRHEQRRGREAAALDRALPEPVTAGPVGGRGGVEADRARLGPEQRGGRRGVDDRARAGFAQRSARRAPRRQRPREVRERERARLARGRHARD
jgi:hypothetical protein